MVPPASHPMWAKLITGDAKVDFKQASASMLIFNLRQCYRQDRARLGELIGEARSFFEKHEEMLADDMQRLFQ